MNNFILIFVCLLVGVLLHRTGRVPDSTPRFLNFGVIYFSLPALIFVQIPALLESTPIDRGLIAPLSMAWLLVLLSLLVFSRLGRRLQWSREQTGTLILTSGLANTSFVGIPILQALMGESAVPVGLIVDQAGSFLALSTIGFGIAAYYGGSRVNVGMIVRRILLFPPFLSLVAAVLWWRLGTPGREALLPFLRGAAATLVPLALVSVGLQLRVSRTVLKEYWRPLALGLGFKLIMAPALLLGLYASLLSTWDAVSHVTILQAAMAPMITSAIVAIQFGLDKELAGLMLGIGIPLSMLTVPLWHVILLNLGL